MGKPKRKDLPDLSDLARVGAEIPVQAKPGASRNAVRYDGTEVQISVTTNPEGGKANAAIHALLASAMGVARSHLMLKRGHTSRNKLFVYVGDLRS